MKPDDAKLLEGIAAASRELPRGVVGEVCDALEDLAEDAPPGQRAAIPGIVASPGARARVSGLVEA